MQRRTAPGEGDPAMTPGPQDVPAHAGHIVRRVLLRRGIVIDAQTAQLVADAVHTALQAAPPAPPQRRKRHVPPDGCEPLF